MIPYRQRWQRSEGGVFTRAPHMMGMGMGVGFSSSPPWTPAAAPGCILYGGGYLEARATRAAQPTAIVNKTFDVDTSGWSAFDSVLSRETADPAVGAGHLRVTASGAGSAQAYQNLGLIVGNRYSMPSLYLRKGGAATNARVYFGTTGVGVTTTDVAWLQTAAEATCAGDAILRLWVSGVAGYGDFDGLTDVVNRSLTSYTPLYTTIPGSVLAQASATAQPWVSSDGLGIRYQGGDLLQWSAAASAVKCLHDGTGGTLIVAVRPSALGASNVFAATATQATTQIGINLYYTNVGGGTAGLFIANGSAAFDVNVGAATPIVAGTTYVFTFRSIAGANGVSLRKNGVSVVTSSLTAPSAAAPSSELRFGAHSAGSTIGIDGVLGHPFIANRVLSDAECTQVEQYILAQATL